MLRFKELVGVTQVKMEEAIPFWKLLELVFFEEWRKEKIVWKEIVQRK